MDELSRPRAVASMAPAWLAALVGAILVGILSGEFYLTWLPVVMTVSILLAFGVQLTVGMRPGLVARLGGSLTGSLAILAVATAVLLLVEPDGLHFIA